jgi:Ca2+/H+ antiporter, TMEM165/GDT1 family
MTAFWVSLFFVLIAEMGDKTQLVALAYATRYTTETLPSSALVWTLRGDGGTMTENLGLRR